MTYSNVDCENRGSVQDLIPNMSEKGEIHQDGFDMSIKIGIHSVLTILNFPQIKFSWRI